MKYETQKIAYIYFIAALALFAIQVLGGLLAGWIYVMPNTLSELLPFNTVRMLHTNSLIVWLLLGFFGAAYFLIPEETEREIHSPQLAYLQLAILVLGTLAVVVTYVFNLFEGHWLLGKEGREFIEQPVWVKVGHRRGCADVPLQRHNDGAERARKTAITNILLLGLWGLALLFLFSFYNPSKTWRWTSNTGGTSYTFGWKASGNSSWPPFWPILMLKLTGVDREIVEKVALSDRGRRALFSGILGTGSPLLLDRHAGVLAVDRVNLLVTGNHSVLCA